jgi:beta-lactamase regulating signal transducer with metallopeptidase domain
MIQSAIDTFAGIVRHPAAQALAWALLQFVWQGAALGAVTAAALFLLRRSAADVRYVVASIGMALMLTLPIVTGVQKYDASRVTAGSPPVRTMASDVERKIVTPSLSRFTDVGRNRVAARAAHERTLAPALILLWLAGVTLLTLRLFGGWIWMQRMRTHDVRPVAPPWEQTLARLARQLHLTRAVALAESTRVDVPTVIGWLRPVVLLPVSAIAALSPAQLEAILAHELAHIRRHDYLVNLLQTLVETLLFYHPAVWWVSRRIRIEREHCCDDLAVTLCGDPIAYANALADLESLRSTAAPFRRADRIAMAATGGSLLHRVRRLLGAPESHSGRAPMWLAASAATLLVAGITVGASGSRSQPVEQRDGHQAEAGTLRAALPTTAATPAAIAAPSHSTASAHASAAASSPLPSTASGTGGPQISQHQHDSHGNWSWSNGDEKMQAEFEGSFDFTDDDTDVRQMSPNGWIKISDGAWLGRHSVEITDRGGQIEHRYYVNGLERPYEPEGRAWLRENLPRFVRNSGIDAPGRVARLLKSGGPPAVLAEIGHIDGNYVRGVYYRELLKQATLPPDDFRKLLTQAGSEMKHSDYDLAQLLLAALPEHPLDQRTGEAFFAAASSLRSDYDAGRVLQAVLKHNGLEDGLRAPFFRMLDDDVHSSFERGRILQAVVARPDVGHDTVKLAIQATSRMDNYEAARVLLAVARRQPITDDVRDSYVQAADRLGQYEQGQVMTALVRSERRK